MTNVNTGKTAGLLSISCLTKEFRPCDIEYEAYDSLGHIVLTEKKIDSATYKISFEATGEYRISFYNKDVDLFSLRNSRSLSLSATSATGAAKK